LTFHCIAFPVLGFSERKLLVVRGVQPQGRGICRGTRLSTS